MTQVKIFSYGGCFFYELENEINEWLSEHPHLNIIDKSITVNSFTRPVMQVEDIPDKNGLHHYLNYTIIIWYEE